MPNSQGLSEALRRPVIGSDWNPKVGIPLSLSGTAPWTISILRDGSIFTEIVIKGGSSSKSLTEIQVDNPGSYQIGKIVDGNGSQGRIENTDPTIIAYCPEARLDGLILKHGVEMCNNTPFPIKVWMAGQAPFTVFFDVVDDKSTEQVVIPNVVPSATKNGNFYLWTYEMLGNSRLSQYLLRISAIQDSTGKLHQYGVWDNGDAVVVNLVSPPVIKWGHPATKPLKLKEKESHIPLNIEMSGRSPFSFEIEQPDGSMLAVKDITKSSTTIKASSPGTYKLASFKDSMCQGNINVRSEISVQLVHPPTLEVVSEVLKSPCGGDMGIAFKFNFTGEGPWKIRAKQRNRKLKLEETLVIDSNTPRTQYRWEPSLPGMYDLDLLNLSDANFANVPLKALHYSQDISPAPDARFNLKSEVCSCVESGVSLPVILSGIGPWKLEYSISQPDGKIQSLYLDASSQKVDIRLDEFTQSGRYMITLLSVTDNNGCSSNSLSQAVPVTVFAHPPFAGFAYPPDEVVKIREGSQDLVAIKVGANKPPVLLRLSHSGKIETFKVDSNTAGIPISKPGEWVIESVSDEFCQGKILQPKVQVVIVPKPTAKFDKEVSPLTCKTSDESKLVKVLISGNGIVNLRYTVQYALDESALKSSQKELKLATGSAPTLSLSSVVPSAPGYYRYELISVSDSSFSEQILNGQFIIQQVLPDPAPRVLPGSEKPSFCYDPAQNKIGPFLLDFTGSELLGSSPVTFNYELFQGSVVHTTGSVTTKESKAPFRFDVENITAPGSYQLRIVRVKNAFGCVWDYPNRMSIPTAIKEQHAMSVNIVERPFIISAPDQMEYFCVGDVARFELLGTGPWTISYTLKDDTKGKKKTDTVYTNRLNILLAEAGTLTVHSVCNKHCCAELPSTGLKYPVHSLPSAAISDGMQILREGEETEFSVALRGVPPFTFSYQQFDESGGRVVDTITVKDVNSNEHRIKVSSSGTFRVVSVKDRFCQYPKKRN